MDIRIHRNFLDSVLELRKSDQQRVKKTLRMVMEDKQNRGLRPHKVGDFWSYSASDSIRIISFKKGDEITVLHADEHDDAYEWADRHTAITDENNKFFGFVDSREINIDDKRGEERGYDEVYDSEEFKRYISFGLPTGLSKFLAKANDDQLLDAITSLAPELQEAVLDIATGGSPDIEAKSPSDISVVEDDGALESALELPGDKWRLFLHPKQRFAVDMPWNNHVMVKGGPGTGKTVTAVHRYSRLINSPNNHNPIFIALTGTTRNIIQDRLKKIGVDKDDINIVMSGEIKYDKDYIEDFYNKYTHIIMDEGQDMPVEMISELKMIFERKDGDVTPHFICYDPNQCVKSPSGHAISTFEDYFDNVTLTYSYRSTKQNIDYSKLVLERLHNKFEGQRFQDRHEISSSRSKATSELVSGIEGPEVESKRIEDLENIADEVKSTLRKFDTFYESKYPKAVIVAADSDTLSTLESSIKSKDVETPILSPEQAKGREFFAGVVIDLTDFYNKRDGDKIVIKSKYYDDISGLYVAVSRFRDRLKCIYNKSMSPLNVR